ncbi:MAG: pentapeptide repeat-containing protein, partial [Candidatus Nitrosopelagicus sp.]|nr:pentapeptide repeat-containing protein [Candidatus Nitrosopelagicus sp.]
MAVAMIGVMVPSGFAEEIPIKLELNKNDFLYSDPIILKITPERIVERTPFDISVVDERGNELPSLLTSFNNYRNIVISDDGTRGYALLVEYDYYISPQPFLARSDLPSQEYTVHVVYGDNLGKNSISFNYDNTKNPAVDFMLKNYRIDKFVLGAFTYYEPVLVTPKIGHEDFVQINVRYDIGTDKNSKKLVQYSLYNNAEKAQETFQDFAVVEYNIINDSTTDPDIPENFQCAPTREGTTCIQNNLIIKAESIYPILELIDRKGLPPAQFTPETTLVTTTPPVVVNPNKIASFVDTTKDPQHYIDRYNNESTYKEWFDENYPQYSSIYQAVGLDAPVAEQINEPEYVPEPVFTPEPVMEQEVNCGPGTESVNGVCQVIQTIEDTSKSIAQPTGKCANLNRGAMLSGCDLHGMDLRTNLAGADLSGANLSGANLDNGVFSGANLSGADLSGTSLCYTHFDGANLSGADFTNSNFCEPHLDGTTGSMGPADMRNVNLSGLDIGNTSFDEVNLSGANLSNLQTPLCADFERSNLINADLSDADLDCAFFTGAWLDYADLSGADLHDANFEFASLPGANLSGADLSGAKFWGDSASAFNEKKLDESLEYVGFTWGSANMQGVNLQNANLQNANLQNANLDGADITGANIFGANFIG